MDMNLSLSGPPQLIIEQQSHCSSEAVLGFLVSLKRNLRRMQGIVSPDDAREQGTQINHELVFLQQFSPLLYLTLKLEFQELYQIFEQDDRFEEELDLIKDIEDEYHRLQRLYLFIDEENQRALKYQEQRAKVNRLHAQAVSERALAHAELLRYFEQELLHLRQSHYQRKTELYEHAYSARLTRMDEALKIAELSPQVSEASREELKILRQHYQDEQERIQRMPTRLSTGQIDLAACARKEDALKRHEAQFAARFDQWLQKNAQTPALRALHAAERQATQALQLALQHEEAAFQAQERALSHHLEAVRTQSNSTHAARVGALMACVQQVDETSLTATQKKQLNHTGQALQRVQSAFATCNSLAEQHALRQTALVAVARLNPIMQQQAPEVVAEWEDQAHQIHQEALRDGVPKSDKRHAFRLLSSLHNPHLASEGAGHAPRPAPPQAPREFIKFKVNYRAQCHLHAHEDMLSRLNEAAESFRSGLFLDEEDDYQRDLQETFDQLHAELKACPDREALNFDLLQSLVRVSNQISDLQVELKTDCERINQWCTCLSPEPLAQEEDFQVPSFRP